MTPQLDPLPALGEELVLPVDAAASSGHATRRWLPSVVTRILREEVLGGEACSVAYAFDGESERPVTRDALTPSQWEVHLRSVVEAQILAQLQQARDKFARVRRVLDGKRQSGTDREDTRAESDASGSVRPRLVDVVPVADPAVIDDPDRFDQRVVVR